MRSDTQPTPNGTDPTWVPLLPPPEIYLHVNLKLAKRLLAEIDAVSRNRSGFLEQAACESLRRVA